MYAHTTYTWHACGTMHDRDRIVKINLLDVWIHAKTMQAEQITQLFLCLGWWMIEFPKKKKNSVCLFVCSFHNWLLVCFVWLHATRVNSSSIDDGNFVLKSQISNYNVTAFRIPDSGHAMHLIKHIECIWFQLLESRMVDGP